MSADLFRRKCPICGVALKRRKGEDATGFYKRTTCGEQACIEAYRQKRSREGMAAREADAAKKLAPPEPKKRGEWPAEMSATAFADNIRERSWGPTRMPGAPSLVSGCSSSSGWNVDS
jgi:hypothetical protein